MSSEISRNVIVDSTCLIVLSKIEGLALLQETYGSIEITPEIAAEFGDQLPAWVQVKEVGTVPLALPASLGPGERSALRLAYAAKGTYLLVLDDMNARMQAKRLGLDFIGTLGVLLEAKMLRKIESVRPFIEKILETNFFLDLKLVDRVLSLAGEAR